MVSSFHESSTRASERLLGGFGVFFDEAARVQLALNAALTPLFFGLKLPGIAFAEILQLLAAVVKTAFAFRRVNKAAGALLVPYIAWVSFAGFLNFTLWRLNP